MIVFADFDHDLKHLGFIDFIIKYIIDDDDDDQDNDDKNDYSCNSVNFKVTTSRFCMEMNKWYLIENYDDDDTNDDNDDNDDDNDHYICNSVNF